MPQMEEQKQNHKALLHQPQARAHLAAHINSQMKASSNCLHKRCLSAEDVCLIVMAGNAALTDAVDYAERAAMALRVQITNARLEDARRMMKDDAMMMMYIGMTAVARGRTGMKTATLMKTVMMADAKTTITMITTMIAIPGMNYGAITATSGGMTHAGIVSGDMNSATLTRIVMMENVFQTVFTDMITMTDLTGTAVIIGDAEMATAIMVSPVHRASVIADGA